MRPPVEEVHGSGADCPDERLDALVNGTLRADEAAALEQHLAGCAVCAEERRWIAAEREAFATRAAAQPGPSPDVWARIAARTGVAEGIAAGGSTSPLRAARSQASSRPARRWVAYAVAGALAVAAALLLVVTTRDPRGVPQAAAQADAGDDGVALGSAVDAGVALGKNDGPGKPAEKTARAAAALDEADRQLDTAIAELTQEYQRRRAALPPARLRKYDADFRAALDVVEEARAGAGDDVQARHQVVRARSRYLRSIQTVVLKEGS